MTALLKLIEGLLSDPNISGKSPLKDLGYLSCTNTVNIKHVPIYDPCLTLVFAGQKVVYDAGQAFTCDTGNLIALPGPASYDLCNKPDPGKKIYKALLIPFKADLLEKLARSHNLLHEIQKGAVKPIVYAEDDTLTRTIKHYLTTLNDRKLQNHRLMEILLILASRDSRLLSYGLIQTQWSARVRTVLSTEIAKAWNINDVCKQLATTESTLRRNLKQESTSFREILYELRLASALIQLLQTNDPIYLIAYNCGYQSVSRFISNFHKRFGIPPKEFRIAAGENEQNLTA